MPKLNPPIFRTPMKARELYENSITLSNKRQWKSYTELKTDWPHTYPTFSVYLLFEIFLWLQNIRPKYLAAVHV